MRIISTLLFVVALCVGTSAQSTKSLQQLKSERALSLQFETIPNAKQIANLEQMGIHLSSYLGSNTYAVNLSKGADLEIAKNTFGATESNQRRASIGVKEDIQAKRIPDHANHNLSLIHISEPTRPY